MDLLIEIYCEEIPARMQRDALLASQVLFSRLLSEQGISFSEVDTYIATQRLALCAKGVPAMTHAVKEERRGPRIGAPEAAIDGFLKSTGLSYDAMVQRDGYYYVDIVHEGKTLSALLPTILHAFLDQMPWPNSMRWHNPKTNNFTRSWIRPIRSIACILDKKPVVFDVEGLELQTCGYTHGHRFLEPRQIKLKGLRDYKDQLLEAKVIVDFESRRDAISTFLAQKAAVKGLSIQVDETLLDEVTGLVDYPFAHLGVINDAFMHLPEEVLSTSMRVHQKYFTLRQRNGAIAPYFGVITNVPAQPDKHLMIDGFERVLRARLSDAAFFFEGDRNTALSDLTKKLDAIIFHEKLGSVGDKVRRLEVLAMNEVEKRAAHLCKSDLVTQMVGEFPELQGIMGRVYAILQGESADVAAALEEYYQPQGPSQPIPTKPVSWALSLYDKIDTLVGFIGSGIKPTGSKDPLGIRRAILGIFRLIVESDKDLINFNNSSEKLTEDRVGIAELIEKSIDTYRNQGITLADTTTREVVSLLTARIPIYIRDEVGGSYDVVNAVMGGNFRFSDLDQPKLFLQKYVQRSKSLGVFLKTEQGLQTKEAYRRINGILNDCKSIDVSLPSCRVNESLLNESIEKSFYKTVKESKIDALMNECSYDDVMDELAHISKSTMNFFNQVNINTEDEALTRNRKNIIRDVCELFHKVADFSKLEG